jgi:hypothetical protein
LLLSNTEGYLLLPRTFKKVIIMPKPEYEIHRTLPVQGVIAEGHYERCKMPSGKFYWVLRQWRLIVDGNEGTLHRVHGNRKRDFGALLLIRQNPPTKDVDYAPVSLSL